MADEHSSSIDDRLRTTLGTAAEGVTVEPTAPGGFAAAGAARRRRRRGLLAGGTAAALIGVVGLVIVNGHDPSTISTSDEAEMSTPTTDGEVATAGTTVPEDESSDQAATTAPEITTPPTCMGVRRDSASRKKASVIGILRMGATPVIIEIRERGSPLE